MTTSLSSGERKIEDGKKSKGGKKNSSKEVKMGESFKQKMDGQNTEGRCFSFFCKGLHLAREYPRREKVNALTMKSDNADDSNDAPLRVAPLRLVNVATIEKP